MSTKDLILSKSVFLVVRGSSFVYLPRCTSFIVADMNNPQIIMFDVDRARVYIWLPHLRT